MNKKEKVSKCCKADYDIGYYVHDRHVEKNPNFTFCCKCKKDCEVIEVEKVDQRGVGDIERDNYYI